MSSRRSTSAKKDSDEMENEALLLRGDWVPGEGEFVTRFGRLPCILDTGSHALVLVAASPSSKETNNASSIEGFHYGSETIWCLPMLVNVRGVDGQSHHLAAHRVVRRTRPDAVGVMGLAWCGSLGSTPTLTPSRGLWMDCPVAKRGECFRDSVWSMAPSACHLVFDARETPCKLRWLTTEQASKVVERPRLKRSLVFFNHELSDGRTLQLFGWRTLTGTAVLFETGATRSSDRCLVDTVPKVDWVFGNMDMRKEMFWFDLERGYAYVSVEPA